MNPKGKEDPEKRRITILGGGKFGFVLAEHLSSVREELDLWLPDPQEAKRLDETRNVEIFGEGRLLSGNIQILSGYGSIVEKPRIFLVALPSRFFEDTIEQLLNRMDREPAGIFLNFTRGFSAPALRRRYSILTFSDSILAIGKANGFQDLRVAAISGPGLMEEIHAGQTAFLTAGSENRDALRLARSLLSTDRFHVEISRDRIGVELSGLLKNPIAIACGLASGLPGAGDNFQGELLMRGFHEMKELAVHLGGQEETLLGRPGLADLITVTRSSRSRNRKYGERFVEKLLSGEDRPGLFARVHLLLNPNHYIEKEVLQGQHLAEGVFSLVDILELAKDAGVSVPLYTTVYRILTRKEAPDALLRITGTTSGEAGSESEDLPVVERRTGVSYISGQNFQSLLESRILREMTASRGMLNRIERQSVQILSLLDRRLETGEFRGDSSPEDMRNERAFWSRYVEAPEQDRRAILQELIHYYVGEISDHYQPGVREALLKVLRPFRSALGGFRPHSAIPWIGGNVDEVRALSGRYNILYTPTHKSHLDSVEVAFGLSYLGLPIPRYAAGKVLMSSPTRSWLLKSMGAYAVDRQRTRNILYLECLRTYSTQLLEAGIPILVFPEGTRSRSGRLLPVKTGLLSTAVEAFQNTGREIIVVPIALSYETIPEDVLFSDEGKGVRINDYFLGRGRVFMDFGEPIHVSRHMKKESPTLSIAYEISRSWETNIRVLPNHILARVIRESGGTVQREMLPGLIRDFVSAHPAHYLETDPDRILDQGLRQLKQRKILAEDKGRIRSLSAGLLEYYAGMFPGSGDTEVGEEIDGGMD